MLDKKRICSLCLLLVLMFTLMYSSCNKSQEAMILEIELSIKDDYMLKELDKSKMGLGNPGGMVYI